MLENRFTVTGSHDFIDIIKTETISRILFIDILKDHGTDFNILFLFFQISPMLWSIMHHLSHVAGILDATIHKNPHGLNHSF